MILVFVDMHGGRVAGGVYTAGGTEMPAAPARKLIQLSRRRKADVTGDLKLHAGREGYATPHAARKEQVAFGALESPRRLPATFAAIEGLPNLVERPPGFLHGLDAQELLEMFAAVVVSPTDAERRRQKPLLDVVPNRASRHAAEIREIADGVSEFVGHNCLYDSHCRIINCHIYRRRSV